MTISVHSFLALLLVTGMMSCTRQSNSISDLKLECGDDVDTSKSYIKVLDQEGQAVRSENLEIRDLSSPQENGQPQLTNKGCVQRPNQGSFAIVGQGPLKSQALVLSSSRVQDSVTLKDISRWKLQVDCREPTPTQGQLDCFES